jgi:hypothetical protein
MSGQLRNSSLRLGWVLVILFLAIGIVTAVGGCGGRGNRSAVKTVTLTNRQDATLLPVRPFQLQKTPLSLVAYLSFGTGMGPTGSRLD